MVNKFCDRLKTHNLVFYVGASFGSLLPINLTTLKGRQVDWGFDRIELGSSMIEGTPRSPEYISSCKNNPTTFPGQFNSC